LTPLARLPAAFVVALAFVVAPAALASPPDERGTARVQHVAAAVPLPASLSLPHVQPDRPDLESASTTPFARTHRASLHARPGGLHVLDRATVFAGLASNDAGDHTPPDVAVAAGGGYVVELVNEARRVWTAGGTLLDNSTGLAQMFKLGNDNISDPRILFDAPSGRFIASVMDIDRGEVVLGVSAGANPLADWYFAHVTALNGGVCFDQPKIGTSNNVVIVSANAFIRTQSGCSFSALSFAGGAVWVLNKQELLKSAPSVDWNVWGPERSIASPIAAQAMSASPNAYAAAAFDDGLDLYEISGTPPGATDLRVTSPMTLGFGEPPTAIQPGRQGVTTNDGRLLDAYWDSGKLWLASNDYCLNQGVFRACARVLEVDTALASVAYNTWYGFPGSDSFYPALRPDGLGNVVLVSGISSADTDPGVVVDSFNGTKWAGPTFLHAGVTATIDLRWGDYFGAATDPDVRGLVWVGGEYANGSLWQTAVGAWKTAAVAPYIELPATAPLIANNAASVSAIVDPRGTDTTYAFEYGKTASYGSSTTPAQAAAADGRQAVTGTLSGLVAGTTYHWRFVARSAGGTTASPDQTLRTTGTQPVAKPKPKPKKKKKR
jgi:hypothetical protein